MSSKKDQSIKNKKTKTMLKSNYREMFKSFLFKLNIKKEMILQSVFGISKSVFILSLIRTYIFHLKKTLKKSDLLSLEE